MNLTISKEQLINGLQAVQNVVSNRTTTEMKFSVTAAEPAPWMAGQQKAECSPHVLEP